MGDIQNFTNPEFKKFDYKILCLNGQLSLDKQLRNQKSYYNLPNSVF